MFTATEPGSSPPLQAALRSRGREGRRARKPLHHCGAPHRHFGVTPRFITAVSPTFHHFDIPPSSLWCLHPLHHFGVPLHHCGVPTSFVTAVSSPLNHFGAPLRVHHCGAPSVFITCVPPMFITSVSPPPCSSRRCPPPCSSLRYPLAGRGLEAGEDRGGKLDGARARRLTSPSPPRGTCWRTRRGHLALQGQVCARGGEPARVRCASGPGASVGLHHDSDPVALALLGPALYRIYGRAENGGPFHGQSVLLGRTDVFFVWCPIGGWDY